MYGIKCDVFNAIALIFTGHGFHRNYKAFTPQTSILDHIYQHFQPITVLIYWTPTRSEESTKRGQKLKLTSSYLYVKSQLDRYVSSSTPAKHMQKELGKVHVEQAYIIRTQATFSYKVTVCAQRSMTHRITAHWMFPSNLVVENRKLRSLEIKRPGIATLKRNIKYRDIACPPPE